MMPRGYIQLLAVEVYRSGDPRFRRRVKHWRSGKMKTQIEVRRIFAAAENISKRYGTQKTN